MRERVGAGRGAAGAWWSLLVLVLTAVGAVDTARAQVRDEPEWRTGTAVVDRALGAGDASAAVRAWHDAHAAARAARSWEGMLAVGDAALRIGDATRTRAAAEADARDAYLAALFGARRAGSLEGVLRAMEAFAALGDRVMVNRCAVIAEALVARLGDPLARALARARAERSVNRLRAEDTPDGDGP